MMPSVPCLLQDIDNYKTFSMLPRDISQQILNELVYSGRLTDVSLEKFRDCALQVAHTRFIKLAFFLIVAFLIYCQMIILILKRPFMFFTGSLLGRMSWGR